jgi:D-3-phosphoglycerate dehydrogenase
VRVLVTEAIADEGLEILSSCAQVDVRLGLKPEEILAVICDYDALVVRSQTQASAEIIEAGKNLQVIARAGVGIDNVDIEAATRR